MKDRITAKINKSKIEKKRRARINVSLLRLKDLVLTATRQDKAKYNKLEKADILELAVKYLENMEGNVLFNSLDNTISQQCNNNMKKCNGLKSKSPKFEERFYKERFSCYQASQLINPLEKPNAILNEKMNEMSTIHNIKDHQTRKMKLSPIPLQYHLSSDANCVNQFFHSQFLQNIHPDSVTPPIDSPSTSPQNLNSLPKNKIKVHLPKTDPKTKKLLLLTKNFL
ncbi:hypothetical protein A3Q56_00952 [Intoshia linei]|uniref:BHLH domain-containing protein n=1 Tax=Intoshia linei TaxID=1819745 RepID=A0A177BAD5_9BILA|nr:hypothetical protein A3Q56_00952 [Intoshia linei]